MLVTFALHPTFPIACEGDDDLIESITLNLFNCTSAQARDWLESLLGGYVQIWSEA